MELLVRPARVDDAADVVDILNPIIASKAFSVLDTPFTADAEREYIRNFPERGIFLVAERARDGKVIGFQDVEPFAAYTHAFDHVGVIGTFVQEGSRRQGVAARLFNATFAAAREKAYEKLFSYVRADNPGALQTYLARGFSVVGTAKRQAKIDGQYIDETIIEKFL
jgi:L-amino acid N-acyltransferase YncA